MLSNDSIELSFEKTKDTWLACLSQFLNVSASVNVTLGRQALERMKEVFPVREMDLLQKTESFSCAKID